MTKRPSRKKRFVISVPGAGYPAPLELHKLYQAFPDAEADRHRLVPVVDKSAEDYRYYARCFVAVDLPQPLRMPCAAAPSDRARSAQRA